MLEGQEDLISFSEPPIVYADFSGSQQTEASPETGPNEEQTAQTPPEDASEANDQATSEPTPPAEPNPGAQTSAEQELEENLDSGQLSTDTVPDFRVSADRIDEQGTLGTETATHNSAPGGIREEDLEPGDLSPEVLRDAVSSYSIQLSKMLRVTKYGLE